MNETRLGEGELPMFQELNGKIIHNLWICSGKNYNDLTSQHRDVTGMMISRGQLSQNCWSIQASEVLTSNI